jgi:hypothetical protein
MCPAERFVVNEKFVLRKNISVRNRQLLLAAKRYGQVIIIISFYMSKLLQTYLLKLLNLKLKKSVKIIENNMNLIKEKQ